MTDILRCRAIDFSPQILSLMTGLICFHFCCVIKDADLQFICVNINLIASKTQKTRFGENTGLHTLIGGLQMTLQGKSYNTTTKFE